MGNSPSENLATERIICALHVKPYKESIRLKNFTFPFANSRLLKELLTHFPHIHSTLFSKKVKIFCRPTSESACQNRTDQTFTMQSL